jgi:hypothetical protein
MINYTYEKTKEILEAEGCELITSEDEFNIDAQKKKHLTVKTLCGHIVEDFNIYVFIRFKVGLRCKKCTKENMISDNKKMFGDTTDGSYMNFLEYYGISLITKWIEKNFILEKTNDACLADIIIKPKNIYDDIWLPIQLKFTMNEINNSYSFHINNNYKDMYLFAMCLCNEKIWLINGNELSNVLKLTISDVHSEKYDKFFVLKDGLNNKFITMYNDNKIKKITKKEANRTTSEKHQKEYDYRELREEKINFLSFEYPKISCMVYDFKINGYKIQEKITFKKNIYDFAILHKNGGTKSGNQSKIPYDKGDSDFYWFNFQDKNTFYIIPEDALICQNLINVENNSAVRNINFSTYRWTDEYRYTYDNLDKNKLINLFQNKKINDTINNEQKILDKIKLTLEEMKIIYDLKEPKKEKKIPKCIDCEKEITCIATRCDKCAGKFRFEESCKKNNRPSYEQLIKDFNEITCKAMGKKYGVTDNTVRKWIKNYEKYGAI